MQVFKFGRLLFNYIRGSSRAKKRTKQYGLRTFLGASSVTRRLLSSVIPVVAGVDELLQALALEILGLHRSFFSRECPIRRKT